MKTAQLVSLIVIILFAGRAGCTPASIPPKSDSTSTGAENVSSPQPYKLNLNPADFVAVVDNPYFPLIPGAQWIYEKKLMDGTAEINTIEILPETREIMGITAVTMHDVVTMEGVMVEETHDWYAQDKDGNVWYLGESVDNYENGVLVNHDGSWEYGMNGALPGMMMWADPAAHWSQTYYQEYYLGEAMDLGQVLRVNESVTVPFGLFKNVVRTYDSSALDPNLKEEKFYAKGIGLIKEMDNATGENLVLLEFTPGGETAARALPTTLERERVDLVEPMFSNPTVITNPLFPVTLVTKTLSLGHIDGQPLRAEYSLLPDTRIVEWNGQKIETIQVQYVAHLNGRIEEMALDQYAQADDGSVWCFGEDVSSFQDGMVTHKDGTWLAGKDGPAAMIMPANPQVGDVYRVENIPGVAFDEITVRATGVTVDGPQEPIQGAMIAEQRHMDGSYSNKIFAPGYGEFVTIKGSDLEMLALSLPTDSLSTTAPPELEALSKGVESIFEAAQYGHWNAAASSLSEVVAAWDTLQKGDVPFMLETQMSEALAALVGAVNARQPLEARFAALNTANAILDIQLQYRPVLEIELARLGLLARQVRVDIEAQQVAWVKSDVVTLALIRDRVIHTLDADSAAALNALLDELRAAAESENLQAAAQSAQKLFDLLAGFELGT